VPSWDSTHRLLTDILSLDDAKQFWRNWYANYFLRREYFNATCYDISTSEWLDVTEMILRITSSQDQPSAIKFLTD